ncbi:MAG: hypothetical protein R3F39_23465 [Myxococcota bacterium]
MNLSMATVVSACAAFGVAWGGVANAAKPANCGEFQTDSRVGKHLTVSCDRPDMPYWDCKPAGVWAPIAEACATDLLSLKSHRGCATGADGIEGRLSAEHAELFADLAVSGGDDSWSKCRIGPADSSYIGFQGLGFMRAKDRAGVLAALIEPSIANEIGGDGKLHVVQALWRMGAQETAGALAAVLPTGTGVLEFRYAVLQVLSAWGSDAAVPFCTQALGDRHEGTARACVNYLVDRNQTDAVPLILRNIDKLRAEGLVALGRLGAGNAKVKPLLEEKAAAGGNSFVAARLALAELGSPKALKEIQERLKDNGWFRDQVLVLAFASGKKIQAAIIAWLSKEQGRLAKEDKSGNVRALIVRAQLGDAKAVRALGELLDDSDESVRRQALRGIGGTFGTMESTSGRRIVVDKSLIPVVKAFYAVEQNGDDKAMALGAWADLVAATSL